MKEKTQKELLIKLEEAVYAASLYSGNYSDHFSCAEDFYDALKTATEKFKNQDYSELVNVISWFVPTYDWDDFVGNVDLGNDVFNLLLKIRDILEAEKEPKRDKKNTNISESEIKIEPINKKDALKVINDLIRMQEFDAALQIATVSDFSEDEIEQIKSLTPNRKNKS